MDQIRPKQPIFKVETRDIGLLYVFENTHHYQCIHEIIWAYTSENLGQVYQNWVNCLAKFGPKESSWRGEPIEVDVLLSFVRDYKKLWIISQKSGKLHFQKIKNIIFKIFKNAFFSDSLIFFFRFCLSIQCRIFPNFELTL